MCIRDRPIGMHTITYTATDACGNSDTDPAGAAVSVCSFEITVVDDVEPIAVCEQTTVVSLNFLDQVEIPASVFDDESYDDCGPVTFQVQRMDNPACPGFDGTGIVDYAPFFCCDVGTTVMVSLIVTDGSGNTSSCMAEVEVQDKVCLLYTSPSPRDATLSRMPSSA